MRMCVFEDGGAGNLEPLALTRPVFDLRCGAMTLLQRLEASFHPRETGALVRPYIGDLCRRDLLVVNDAHWLRQEDTLLVNGRWLPPPQLPSLASAPCLGLVNGIVAYALLTPRELTYCSLNTLDDCLESWKLKLPRREAGGTLVQYPWDLVEQNAAMIWRDYQSGKVVRDPTYLPVNLSVVGPSELVVADAAAAVEPFVVANTTRGPVIIDRDARIESFSRLEGPCYVGPGSHILGAQVRSGTSIGRDCRVGGEVEASILHGFVNKRHQGFLGHSYVGEWVNLAAGVEVSDLRQDYQPIAATVAGRPTETGLIKAGAYVGDHAKIGLNVLLNAGAVVGAFCQLLPSGSLLPKTIPSYCTVRDGQLQEHGDVLELYATAVSVMKRRGQELTAAQMLVYRMVHELTAVYRKQRIAHGERRRPPRLAA